MNNTLLGSISKKAINEFRKDLLQMLRIGKEFDKYYAESNQDFSFLNFGYFSWFLIFSKTNI